MNEPHDPTKLPKWGFFALAAAFIGALAYPTVALYFQSDLAKLGQFGDMFGALNAVISSFGFVGLLISLHLQRRQFRASLADMRDNAEATKAEAKAIHAQATAATAQAEALTKNNRLVEENSRAYWVQIHFQNLSAQLNAQLGILEAKRALMSAQKPWIDGKPVSDSLPETVRKIHGLSIELEKVKTSYGPDV